MPQHPSEALVQNETALPVISCCDHYAGNPALGEKALALQEKFAGAFDVTLDLEDGAAKGNEGELLGEFLALLASSSNRYKKVGIRIQDFRSPNWRDQIEEIVEQAGEAVSHITIPKTRTWDELGTMLEFLREQCKQAGISREIPVHVLIETPAAIQEIRSIATLPWLRCLDFGLMDFVSSHGGVIPAAAMKSPLQFDHPLISRAKTEIVAAATANNLIASHNVTVAHSDATQTAADASRARNEFGFLRMWSIHPNQIAPILEAMRPAAAETALASKILQAASEKDWAPISIDGTLHDRASYRFYWELLQRARTSGANLDTEAERLFFTD